MKKITFLLFLFSACLLAQQPKSYTESINDLSGSINPDSGIEGIFVNSSNGNQGIIDVYSSLSDFTNAVADNCTDTALTSEDFAGGPGAITACGTTIDSDGGTGCYPAGELEEGFNVEASNSTEVISIPSGGIGNADPLVGANTFAEFTVINFDPEVYAVAMDVWNNSDPSTEVRVYGTGDVLIETIAGSFPVSQQTFFGVVADEPISKIELEGANGSGELFGNFLFGADCTLSIGDNQLSQVSIYPNPSSGILNIETPASVEVNSVAVYDVLGKKSNVSLVNGQVNISNLANGVYILSMDTNAGTLTQKIVKN
jgi:hypothetical protein|tara:strand:- start:124116 stop:125057 length:942 start_codon:yes stop_codon:yes gene_type:complete